MIESDNNGSLFAVGLGGRASFSTNISAVCVDAGKHQGSVSFAHSFNSSQSGLRSNRGELSFFLPKRGLEFQ